MLIIGGDWNVQVGKDKDKSTCGKYGLRETNRQGRDFFNRIHGGIIETISGLMVRLEMQEKQHGRKIKMMLYWRKTIKNAG